MVRQKLHFQNLKKERKIKMKRVKDEINAILLVQTQQSIFQNCFACEIKLVINLFIFSQIKIFQTIDKVVLLFNLHYMVCRP